MGHLLDVFNNQIPPSQEQAALWHSVGHDIWSYANPHVGQDYPEAYRLNYGLLLWAMNYDGTGICAYQHNVGNPYNDFDSVMRELNVAYPTIDGVIDTIAWEAYREGIDDVRYVTTLINAIELGKASTDTDLLAAALDAEQYLQTLDVQSADMDTIRGQMIGHLWTLFNLSPLNGDVNGDGFVGGDDLTIILTNWGQSVTGREQGDLNGDFFVGGDDYSEVLSHWGTGIPPQSVVAGTPEPATLGLLLMGGLALLRRRR